MVLFTGFLHLLFKDYKNYAQEIWLDYGCKKEGGLEGCGLHRR